MEWKLSDRVEKFEGIQTEDPCSAPLSRLALANRFDTEQQDRRLHIELSFSIGLLEEKRMERNFKSLDSSMYMSLTLFFTTTAKTSFEAPCA
jgi:hypothetical protein